MKPGRERCGTRLSPEGEAMICSYECTFSPDGKRSMQLVCPNGGGELVARPRRAMHRKESE